MWVIFKVNSLLLALGWINLHLIYSSRFRLPSSTLLKSSGCILNDCTRTPLYVLNGLELNIILQPNFYNI